jgi:hypothetical protein
MLETIHDATVFSMLLNQSDICPRISVIPCVADAIRSSFTTSVISDSSMIEYSVDVKVSAICWGWLITTSASVELILDISSGVSVNTSDIRLSPF